MEKIFADLLRDSPYSDHRWHSLRRGGAAAAFHRSPNVAYFVWWGRWKRLATALEYALGYSDLAVVGDLVLPWPVGGQTPGERLAVLLADLWGDPMYANPERKSPKASLEIAAPLLAGPVVPWFPHTSPPRTGRNGIGLAFLGPSPERPRPPP